MIAKWLTIQEKQMLADKSKSVSANQNLSDSLLVYHSPGRAGEPGSSSKLDFKSAKISLLTGRSGYGQCLPFEQCLLLPP